MESGLSSMKKSFTFFLAAMCDNSQPSAGSTCGRTLCVKKSARLTSAREIFLGFKCFSKMFAFGVAVSCPKSLPSQIIFQCF